MRLTPYANAVERCQIIQIGERICGRSREDGVWSAAGWPLGRMRRGSVKCRSGHCGRELGAALP